MIQDSHSWAYPEKNLIQKDIRIPMFVVSLPTVAKIQRQQMMDVSINR